MILKAVQEKSSTSKNGKVDLQNKVSVLLLMSINKDEHEHEEEQLI